MARPEKISKQCPVCKGKKKMPLNLVKLLPVIPKKAPACTHCKGRGFVFAPPKN